MTPYLPAVNALVLAILLGVAAWRATNAIMYESGPYSFLRTFRKRVGAGEFAPEDAKPELLSDEEMVEFMSGKLGHHPLLGPLFSCFWCASLFVSLILSIVSLPLLLWTGQGWLEAICGTVAVGFAAGAFAIYLEK